MRLFRAIALAFCCFTTLAVSIPERLLAQEESDSTPCWDVFLYGSKAALLADAGQFDEALRNERLSLKGAMKCADTLSIIESHRGMASIFASLGRVDSSYAHVAMAFEFATRPAFREKLPYVLLAQAHALRLGGLPDSSLAATKRAADVANQLGDSLALGYSLFLIGRTALRRGDNEFALSYLDSSLRVLEHTNEPEVRSVALAARGKCLRRLGRLTLACESFNSAFEFLVKHRSHVISDRGHAFVMDESRDFFADWQDAWFAQRNDKPGYADLMALAISERGKGQALLDLVQPDTLIQTDSLFGFVPNPRRRFGPGRDLLQDLQGAFHDGVPPDCAVIYYSQFPESLVISIMKNGDLRQIRLLYPASWLDMFGPLAAAIPDSEMAPPAISGWWSRLVRTESADSVLRMLAVHCFPDRILELVHGARELIIIPDGRLNQIPFAALPVGPRREPLGILYPLRFAPSLAFLAQLEERGRARSRRIESAAVMVLGDPASCTPRLLGARAEAESVAAMFGIKPALGGAASESLVSANWSRLRILHLATHGKAFSDPDSSLDSYVCLFPTNGADGHLTAREILEALPESKFELVVLSACQTAFGSLSKSEGIIGLPRSLLANGAQTVIASMWRLDDSSTSWLIRRFYGHLLNDKDQPQKSVAMHRAMIETRRRWRDPRYWAAFKLYGSR